MVPRRKWLRDQSLAEGRTPGSIDDKQLLSEEHDEEDRTDHSQQYSSACQLLIAMSTRDGGMHVLMSR